MSIAIGHDATHIRRAQPGEAQLLTGLAFRSKASNGYDDAFMAACKAELEIWPDRIWDGEIWVAEEGRAIAGFGELRIEEGTAEVLNMFVAPERKGSGIGRLLWAKLDERARALNAHRMGVGSDPAAQGFYMRMGCVVVGREPSGSIPGRELPRLEMRLT